MISAILYYGIMGLGGVLLCGLYFFHQHWVPLERALLRLEWTETDEAPCPGESQVELTGTTMRVRYADGELHEFRAGGMKVSPECVTVIHLGNRRLLVLLDRSASKRTYLIDTARAAEHGAFGEGVLGWWKHGTGTCIASAGNHVVEVHRCIGRDRVYWIDPLRAMAGNALGLGIERTLIAPTRKIDRIEYRDRRICLARGSRIWRVELA